MPFCLDRTSGADLVVKAGVQDKIDRELAKLAELKHELLSGIIKYSWYKGRASRIWNW